MSNELLIIELRRIADALEKIAENDELREWSATALNAFQRGTELMSQSIEIDRQRVKEWAQHRQDLLKRFPPADCGGKNATNL
jgi:hypothetical protein